MALHVRGTVLPDGEQRDLHEHLRHHHLLERLAHAGQRQAGDEERREKEQIDYV